MQHCICPDCGFEYDLETDETIPDEIVEIQCGDCLFAAEKEQTL